MQEKWIKPDYEEIHVAGECTAYAAARVPTKAEQVEVADVSRNRPEGYPELHPALAGEGLAPQAGSPGLPPTLLRKVVTSYLIETVMF